MDKKETFRTFLIVVLMLLAAFLAMAVFFGQHEQPGICYMTVSDGQFAMAVRVSNVTLDDHKETECAYLENACKDGLFARFNNGTCKWQELSDGPRCYCRLA